MWAPGQGARTPRSNTNPMIEHITLRWTTEQLRTNREHSQNGQHLGIGTVNVSPAISQRMGEALRWTLRAKGKRRPA